VRALEQNGQEYIELVAARVTRSHSARIRENKILLVAAASVCCSLILAGCLCASTRADAASRDRV